MNLDTLRPSFSIYLLDDELERGKPLALHLSQAGYNCEIYHSKKELLEAIPEAPPHMVLFHYGNNAIDAREFVREMMDMIPESHVIVLSSQEQMTEALELYHVGIHDCLLYPPTSFDQILRVCDHAAERDYYVYVNEELKVKMQTKPLVEVHSEPSFALFDIWLKDLISKTNLKDATESFLREVSRYLDNAPVIFLKYVSAYHSLAPAQACGIEIERWRGLGLQLSTVEPAFHPEKLRQPQSLTSLKELMKQAFDQEDFTALPLLIQEGVKGIFVLLKGGLTHDAYIRACLRALTECYERLGLEKRLHTETVNDSVTGVLNRAHFLRKLAEEVSRSRRTNLPVSLVIASLDDPSHQGVMRGSAEMDLLMKMVATIFRKNSRVNDLVGRLGPEEFGLILPHTDRRGATIKAERLRRIVESADFSKVITSDPKVTLSLGVSEYPSFCQDADELLQTADEALFQIKKTSSNKVCIAVAPDGFVPDFFVARV